MMLTFHEMKSIYIDDFADTDEIGIVTNGSVYDGNAGVAFYFSRWFPERKSDIELLVVLLPNAEAATRCSLGFFCSGQGQVRLVNASSLWIDWSELALPMTAHEATAFYPRAYDRALEIARLALVQDATIREYIQSFET